MSRFVLTRTAQRELEHIWRYIGRESPDHADLVEEAIYETCHLAAQFPDVGRTRPEYKYPQVRFLTVKRYDRYVIGYIPGPKATRIVRVLHGALDFSRLKSE